MRPDLPATTEPCGWLEQALLQVEQPQDALQRALLEGDLPALELRSHELYAQLARTVDIFMRSGCHAPLRHRLASAGARVSALRDTLACAPPARPRPSMC